MRTVVFDGIGIVPAAEGFAYGASSARSDSGVKCWAIYGPGRVRVVKLVLTAGTTQACSGGQPVSVVGLRHRDAVAGVTSEGKTVLSSGSA
jgi:hypothetical protein